MKAIFIFIFFFCFSFSASAKQDELIIAIEEWPACFNPVLQSGTTVFSVGAQIFAGLTRLDEQGNVVPYLAEKWDLSDDRKTYTFHLKENAFFHDNSKITADDVVYSINFSKENHPFHPFLEHIRHVKPLDENTVEITLKYPMDVFPSFLIPILVPVLPRWHCDYPSLNYPLIGSGPFKIITFEENSSVCLERFDKFFLDEKPVLKYITFKVFFDFYEIFYALTCDDIDLFLFYPCSGIASYIDAKTIERFSVFPIDYIYPYMVITYNMRKSFFQDIRVRRALSLALDKEKLASFFQSEFVKPVSGAMPFTNPYYTPIRREFDIEKANELLDEAGYARDNSGKRFSISMDYLAYSYMSDIIHWVQSEWSKNLGIELILRDRNAFVNIGQKNLLVDFDLFFDELLLWHDPLIGMYRLYAEDNINKNKLWTNIGAYHNQEIEILFKKAAVETDEERKKALYAEIQQALSDDYASLWLISNMYYVIAKKNVHGLEKLPHKTMSPMLDVAVK